MLAHNTVLGTLHTADWIQAAIWNKNWCFSQQYLEDWEKFLEFLAWRLFLFAKDN